DSVVYFMIGLSYVKQDNPILALPFLQRAINLDNKDAQKLFQYVLALSRTGYFIEAESYFNQVRVRYGTHPDVIDNLALVKVEQEDVLEALELLDKVLLQSPKHDLAKQAKATLQKSK